MSYALFHAAGQRSSNNSRAAAVSYGLGEHCSPPPEVEALLLSPHCLPCLASLVVVHALHVQGRTQEAAGGSQQGAGRPAGGSSRGGRQSSSASGRRSSTSCSSSCSSRSSSQGGFYMPTPCQLELFKLLGLAPQLTAAVEESSAYMLAQENFPALFLHGRVLRPGLQLMPAMHKHSTKGTSQLRLWERGQAGMR